ncbi:hypothetical protein DPX16_8944 [Anabarilius grahami]|uniref:Uncharacterized protein n=1 Tax=Anabarilius grahami TaxID=495550 RepID=A0A3N0ZAA9_ANAGA|nr:hypothetical protein DPX16_8944 [Anabarilius grahami]
MGLRNGQNLCRGQSRGTERHQQKQQIQGTRRSQRRGPNGTQELGDWVVEGLRMEPDHLSSQRSREFEGGNIFIFIHRPQINKPVVWAAGTHFRMALVASSGSRTDMAAGSGSGMDAVVASGLTVGVGSSSGSGTGFMAGWKLMEAHGRSLQVDRNGRKETGL